MRPEVLKAYTGRRLTVDFIEKTRCVNQGAEIRRILDTKALRQASNLVLLSKPPDGPASPSLWNGAERRIFDSLFNDLEGREQAAASPMMSLLI